MKSQFLSLVSLTMATGLLSLSDIRGLPLPQLLPKDADLDKLSEVRIHTLFEEQALRCPDMPVLYSAESLKSITYTDLNKLSNQRAHCTFTLDFTLCDVHSAIIDLRSIGISCGKVVFIFLKRDFSVAIWALSILKAGATVVVADQSHPFERNKRVLEIAEPAVIVKDDESPDLACQLLAGFSGQISDVTKDQFAHFPSHNLDHHETKDTDLAFIVFTSGSMGTLIYQVTICIHA